MTMLTFIREKHSPSSHFDHAQAHAQVQRCLLAILIAAFAMEISKLLCSPLKIEAASSSEISQPIQNQTSHGSQISIKTQPSQLTPVPDNKRKRPYKMSARQRQQRQEYQQYESLVYNLNLDINDLRQQIQHLLECRDLHITRFFLDGQNFESDVLRHVWALLDCLRRREFGLAPRSRGIFDSRACINHDASKGVHQFVMEPGRPCFSKHSMKNLSIQILAKADNLTPGEDADTIRRVCGDDGGCIVEILLQFGGQVTRHTLSTLLPRVLSDDILTRRIIGHRVAFTARLLLYFNRQRKLVLVVLQANLIAGLHNLSGLDPKDFAALVINATE